jgi:hypothetical protein
MKVNFFWAAKRKVVELAVMLGLCGILWFIWGSFSWAALFSLGYIWNWAASQEVSYVSENRRYRFSFLKMVYNLHKIFLKPFQKWPPIFKFFPKLLPAGLFWLLMLQFAESELPWWPVFLGSLVYELFQLDTLLIKNEVLPP